MARYSLSALKTVFASHHYEPFWVGITVHKRSYHLALLRSVATPFTLVVLAIPEKLVEKLRHLDIVVDGVDYETGPTVFSLPRTLQT